MIFLHVPLPDWPKGVQPAPHRWTTFHFDGLPVALGKAWLGSVVLVRACHKSGNGPPAHNMNSIFQHLWDHTWFPEQMERFTRLVDVQVYQKLSNTIHFRCASSILTDMRCITQFQRILHSESPGSQPRGTHAGKGNAAQLRPWKATSMWRGDGVWTAGDWVHLFRWGTSQDFSLWVTGAKKNWNLLKVCFVLPSLDPPLGESTGYMFIMFI